MLHPAVYLGSIYFLVSRTLGLFTCFHCKSVAILLYFLDFFLFKCLWELKMVKKQTNVHWRTGAGKKKIIIMILSQKMSPSNSLCSFHTAVTHYFRGCFDLYQPTDWPHWAHSVLLRIIWVMAASLTGSWYSSASHGHPTWVIGRIYMYWFSNKIVALNQSLLTVPHNAVPEVQNSHLSDRFVCYLIREWT